ncbi:MAG: RNA-binding S4 domain-containing protein [Candidatus Eisenbacteria bacterium]
MRIDLFLKKVCIAKSRSFAAKLCEDGGVTVNGRVAKSSKEVKPGDEVSVNLPTKELVFSIVALPEENVSKARALTFYSLISQKEITGAF